MSHAAGVSLVSTLRRLLRPPRHASLERCELCDAELPERHLHLADVHARRLVCACRLCGTMAGVAGRYRAVGTARPAPPGVTIPEAQWATLGIPVDLAFVFFNTQLARIVAVYPGPAGPTESRLPLDAWSAIAAGQPALREMAPDVEALLVRRTDDQSYRGWLVPIDACYELVGRIRRHWSGLGGGDTVRQEIDRFFGALHGEAS